MSISSEIQALQTNLEDCYTAVSNKGGTLPASENFDNLSTAIESIPSGGATVPWTQPVLTANGTIGGNSFAVAMDSQYQSRAAWYAFDGVTTYDGNKQAHTANGQPHWIEFYNPQPLIVTKMTVYNGGDNVCPLDWQFQCSDDNSTWTTLTSGTNTEYTAGGMWSFNVPNSGAHKYYRFYTTSGYGRDSGYLGITEFVITAKEVNSEYSSYVVENGVASRRDMVLGGTEFLDITEINANGLSNAFVHCGLTGVLNMSALTTIGNGGLYNTFAYCSGITSVNFANLATVGSLGLSETFSYCSALTDVYFNALTTTSFGTDTDQFDNMLLGTGTGVAHTLHFPSNLETTIQGLSGYPNFGGASGYVTLAFDLPATS
jgi:hypothetical protein